MIFFGLAWVLNTSIQRASSSFALNMFCLDVELKLCMIGKITSRFFTSYVNHMSFQLGQ